MVDKSTSERGLQAARDGLAAPKQAIGPLNSRRYDGWVCFDSSTIRMAKLGDDPAKSSRVSGPGFRHAFGSYGHHLADTPVRQLCPI